MIDKMKDDELVELFFSEHKFEIEDNGFSQRVIQSLPQSSWRANRIWTVVCSLAAMALFVVEGGFKWIQMLYYSMMGNTAGWIASFHFHAPSLHTVLIAYIGILSLVCVGCYNIYLSLAKK